MTPGEAAARLRADAEALRRLPLSDLLAGLGAAHAEWAAPGSRLRAEAVAQLGRATGYAGPVIDRSLIGLFGGMTVDAMARHLAESTPAPAAQPPRLTVVIGSGNIPGAALPSVVQALLARSPVLAKSAAAEPVLLPAYRASLAAHAPLVARHLAALSWPGGDEAVEEPVLALADAVVAYGGEPALASLRSRLAPGARFVGHGHRWSLAAIGRERLTRAELPELARLAALDVATFDQQGCLSPQSLYVEAGGEVNPDAFCEALAEALAALAVEYPRRPLAAAEAAALHRFRAEAELRALAGDGRLWASPGGLAWTVALDPDPTPGPCPLNRTAIARPVADLDALPALTRRVPGCLSATVALAAARLPGFAAALRAAGLTRVAPLGRAQEPEDVFQHDGVNLVAALLQPAA
jgi:hypothetical protein